MSRDSIGGNPRLAEAAHLRGEHRFEEALPLYMAEGVKSQRDPRVLPGIYLSNLGIISQQPNQNPGAYLDLAATITNVRIESDSPATVTSALIAQAANAALNKCLASPTKGPEDVIQTATSLSVAGACLLNMAAGTEDVSQANSIAQASVYIVGRTVYPALGKQLRELEDDPQAHQPTAFSEIIDAEHSRAEATQANVARVWYLAEAVRNGIGGSDAESTSSLRGLKRHLVRDNPVVSRQDLRPGPRSLNKMAASRPGRVELARQNSLWVASQF